MNSIDIHREALKERQALPTDVAVVFAEIEEALLVADVYAPGLTHKREQGWGKRTMLVGDARYRGTTYRMAWEVITRTEVVVWAYGPNEGFYRKLARRAKQ
jgi:mRNA-degrading endonuclease RelE of RelBE toxin-antitoxin system